MSLARPGRPTLHYRVTGETAPIRWPAQAISEGVKCYAHLDPSTGKISVSTKHSESVQAWSLLHEFIHEIFPEWGEEMVGDGENRVGDHLAANRAGWMWILSRLVGDERPKPGGKR